MLVLSRKLGEKIFIGENICITVVDIDRGKIRLGIEAPRDVPIFRQELLPLVTPRTDPPKVAAAVRAMEDLDRLDRWLDAALTAPCLDIFRAMTTTADTSARITATR